MSETTTWTIATVLSNGHLAFYIDKRFASEGEANAEADRLHRQKPFMVYRAVKVSG